MSTPRNVAMILAASPTTTIGTNDTFYLAKANASDAAITGADLLTATTNAAMSAIAASNTYAPSTNSNNYAPAQGSPYYLRPTNNLGEITDVIEARNNLQLGSAARNQTADFAPATGSTVYVSQAVLANYAPATGSTAYAPASGSPNYAPTTGSSAYAPATGSSVYATQAMLANYAPAQGSANYAPASGSANYLKPANNLSDVADIPTARTNLGLGTAALSNATAFAPASGSTAYAPISGSSNYAPYSGSSNYLNVANNLSDVANAATARTNLGLGTAATSNATAFAPASGSANYANVTGTNASGTWPISVTGNAATANSAASSATVAALAGSTVYGNPTTQTSNGVAIPLGNGLSIISGKLAVTFPPSMGTIDNSSAAGVLAYYALPGVELSPLTLGMNLSITSGVLNAATGNPMLPAGKIFVGNDQNSANPVTMSGDASIAESGAVTVSHAALADSATNATNANYAATSGSATSATTSTTAGNLTGRTAQTVYGNPATTGTGTGSDIALDTSLSITNGKLTVNFPPSMGTIDPSTGAGFIAYYPKAGMEVAPLTLGNNLSITGTTLNAASYMPNLNTNYIYVGSSTNTPVGVPASGDLTVDSTGKFTVNHATNANTSTSASTAGTATTAGAITQIPANSLVANPTGSPATSGTVGLGPNLSFSGGNLTVTFPTSNVVPGTVGQVAVYSSTTMVGGVSTLPAAIQTAITQLGTITAGTWNAGIIGGTYGGTGVNNGASLLTYAANVTFAGQFSTTITSTAVSNATLPAGNTTLVPTTGTGASGTWSISITGNAASATTATTAITAGAITSIPALNLYGNSSSSAPAQGAPVPLGNGLSFNATSGALQVTFPASNVNSATTNQLAIYTSSTQIGGTSTIPAAIQATITQLGTIGSGVWNGSLISGAYGGTGVNNGSNTLTLAGATTFAGTYSTTITSTATTNVTLPAGSKTLAANDGSNASGTWPISITGNASSANSATTANSATLAAGLSNVAATSLYGNATGNAANGTPIGIGNGLSFTGTTLNVTFPPSMGTVSSITAGTGLTGGTITTTGTIAVGTNAITYGLLQQASPSVLLGNPSSTAGGANIGEITLGSNLAFSGSTLNSTGGNVTTSTTANSLAYYPTASNSVMPVTPVPNAMLVADSTNTLKWLALPLGKFIIGTGVGQGQPVVSSYTLPPNVVNNGLLVGNSSTSVGLVSAAGNGVLISSSSGTPSWLGGGIAGAFVQMSSALSPAYTSYSMPTGALTANSLLYASSTTAVSQIAPLASSVLTFNSSGVPTPSTTLPALSLTGSTTGVAPTSTQIGYVNIQQILSSAAISVLAKGSGVDFPFMSFTLTPGIWDVWGDLFYAIQGGTMTGVYASVNGSNNTSRPDNSMVRTYNSNSLGNSGIDAPRQRFNVTTSQTVYLMANAVYGGSPTSLTLCGSYYAQRAA